MGFEDVFDEKLREERLLSHQMERLPIAARQVLEKLESGQKLAAIAVSIGPGDVQQLKVGLKLAKVGFNLQLEHLRFETLFS